MRQSQPEGSQQDKRGRSVNSSQDVADTIKSGLERQPRHEPDRSEPGRLTEEADGSACKGGVLGNVSNANKQHGNGNGFPAGEVSQFKAAGLSKEHWSPEPGVGRVAHGIPRRVDRLRCLGNAVVPAQIYPILKAIMEVERCQG